MGEGMRSRAAYIISAIEGIDREIADLTQEAYALQMKASRLSDRRWSYVVELSRMSGDIAKA